MTVKLNINYIIAKRKLIIFLNYYIFILINLARDKKIA